MTHNLSYYYLRETEEYKRWLEISDERKRKKEKERDRER
jgi:hypothetical protein